MKTGDEEQQQREQEREQDEAGQDEGNKERKYLFSYQSAVVTPEHYQCSLFGCFEKIR